MAIKDIFLPLVGEPDAVAIAAIDKCVAVAGDLGARVSAMAVEEDIPVRPTVTVSNDLDNTAAVEAVRSVSDARGLLKAFDFAAIRFGVRNEQKLSRLAAADIPANLAACARLKDLSLVLVKTDDGRSERIVERLIFESGRPILMCPQEFAGDLPVAFDDVVIAWDHTAPAARAVADALPILQSAASVRIITATDDNTNGGIGIRGSACWPSGGTRNQGDVRNGQDRRQFGRKGVRGLCEGQGDRPSGHGRLSSLPAE